MAKVTISLNTVSNLPTTMYQLLHEKFDLNTEQLKAFKNSLVKKTSQQQGQQQQGGHN